MITLYHRNLNHHQHNTPRRAWDHRIEIIPVKEPPYQKNKPLSAGELQVVRKWLDDNLNKGFIRESRSRWAAPLILATKPGRGVRICQDYRGLNNVTIKNQYPLSLIRETLDALCHAKIYTKLDIIAAFNKLRIADGHEWKTAFIIRFGLFESLVMPFVLCDASASFQYYINHQLFKILDKFCTAYLDDVLICPKNMKEHRDHVRQVVSRPQEAGLQIDINKCEFKTTRTKYLGLIIIPEGIEMDKEKVKAIKTWEPPGSTSKICRPLTELLQKYKPYIWGSPQQLAFRTLQPSFKSSPILAYYDYNKKTDLETDASDWASGGVLSQLNENGLLRHVAYFSSKHTPAECNYEIYDKELLAIVDLLEEWRLELQGTSEPFDIKTDHKNLAYFMTTKALSQRQVYRKSEDRAKDITDERLQHRERILLQPSLFEDATKNDILRELNKDSEKEMKAAPIDMIISDVEKQIDTLITVAYLKSSIATAMINSLKNKNCKRWPKDL
ncbi:hypothetical protein K3495_g12831 [Podosphaera aphanis]|nr:hypothetical protein K3495_g12831 [Podosphaera aphanis]